MPLHLLHAPTIAAISTAIGSVPGCGIRKDAPLDGVNATNRVATHEVEFDGWSPALYEIGITAPIVLPLGLGVREQTDAALTALEPFLVVQRARSAAALAQPFPQAFQLSTRGGQDIRLEHLHADASALAAMIHDGDDRRYVRSPRPTAEEARRLRADTLTLPARHRMKTAREAIAQMHRFDRRYEGGSSMRSSVATLSERPGMRLLSWQQPIHTPSIPGDEPQGMLKGSILSIPGTILPETVLQSLVGKRVGDLVDIHPHVSGRFVRAARPLASGGVSLTLAPLAVPIASIHPMSTGEALDHLAGIISREDASPLKAAA